MSLLDRLTVTQTMWLIAAAQDYAYHRCFQGPRSANAKMAAAILYQVVRESVPDWNSPPESWARRWAQRAEPQVKEEPHALHENL